MAKIIYEMKDTSPSVEEAISSPPYKPSIHLPVNQEVADAIDVDDEVELKIRAKVKELRNVMDAYTENEYEIGLEAKSIEIYGFGEYAELAEDEDE